jgi:hypothetical protein
MYFIKGETKGKARTSTKTKTKAKVKAKTKNKKGSKRCLDYLAEGGYSHTLRIEGY